VQRSASQMIGGASTQRTSGSVTCSTRSPISSRLTQVGQSGVVARRRPIEVAPRTHLPPPSWFAHVCRSLGRRVSPLCVVRRGGRKRGGGATADAVRALSEKDGNDHVNDGARARPHP
jgi:hypothetical protein